ncbi:MAG: WxL domain-containing protein, partial [Carnobacterium sp.]
MTRGDVMKIGTLCFLAPLVLVSLGGAVVEAATAGTMNSISDVTFTTNTDPTNPVNPTDPT